MKPVKHKQNVKITIIHVTEDLSKNKTQQFNIYLNTKSKWKWYLAYSNVTTCSAGRRSFNKFFIFLIRSRDERSATIFVLSLAFVDVVMDDFHSRNMAKICLDGWTEEHKCVLEKEKE